MICQPKNHRFDPLLRFHGWDETVPQGSVYLVSIFFCLLVLFFPTRFFSLAQFCFFLGKVFFTFFSLTPDPKFFLGEFLLTPKLTIALNPKPLFLPTYLPSHHADPSLPTSITTVMESLNSLKLQLGFKASLRTWRCTEL
jgi:hypothetical protein